MRNHYMLPLALGVAGIVVSAIGQVGLGLALFAAGLGIAAIHSARPGAVRRSEDVKDSLKPESRAHYVRLERIAREVQEAFAERRNGGLAGLGREAGEASEKILRQVAHALQTRQRLVRAMAERNTAMGQAIEMRQDFERARTTAERESIGEAAVAKQIELDHYDRAERALAEIDAGIRKSEAALRELKAKVLVGGALEGREQEELDIREALMELRATSATIDEAETLALDFGVKGR
jgi:hypothetical protein